MAIFQLGRKFWHCLSWGIHPNGWTGLSGSGVTVFVCVVCMFILMCGYRSRFDIIFVIIVLLLILLCTKLYIHARPVSPVTVQHNMPTVYT